MTTTMQARLSHLDASVGQSVALSTQEGGDVDIHAWPRVVYAYVWNLKQRQRTGRRSGIAAQDPAFVASVSREVTTFIRTRARVSTTAPLSSDSDSERERAVERHSVCPFVCCWLPRAPGFSLQTRSHGAHGVPPHPLSLSLPAPSPELMYESRTKYPSVPSRLPRNVSIDAFVHAVVDSLPSMIRILTTPFYITRNVVCAEAPCTERKEAGGEVGGGDMQTGARDISPAPVPEHVAPLADSHSRSHSRSRSDGAIHASLVTQLLLFARQSALTASQWPLLIRDGIRLVAPLVYKSVTSTNMLREEARFVLTSVPVVVQALFPELWVFVVSGAIAALVEVYLSAQRDDSPRGHGVGSVSAETNLKADVKEITL